MTQLRRLTSGADLAFMLAVGAFLGMIGGFIEQPLVALIGSVALISLFSAYNFVLTRNEGILSGLITGGVIGLVVSGVSFVAPGEIANWYSGVAFGLWRGAVVGAVIGLVTRAQPDKVDPWRTRLFLFVGSMAIGAFLGLGVGGVAGFILGVIAGSAWGWVWAAVLAGVVGSYLGSYSGQPRWIMIGAVVSVAVAVSSLLIGSGLAGVVLGMMSGAVAPMLLVALIAGVGGLTSRGVKAMVVEAAEAPREMLLQAAVPFLAPAVMMGMIVGTTAVGQAGLLALPASLAIVGVFLGALGEIEGRPHNRVTARTIVEMVILGANQWPMARLIRQVTGVAHRKTAFAGALVGALAGVIGSYAGILIGRWIWGAIQTLI